MFGRTIKTLSKNDPRKSKYFDIAYYLDSNPDVAASGVDPFAHYMTTGWKEGRNPSALFNTLFYKHLNLADAEQPENPLLHFLNRGEDASLRKVPESEKEFTDIQKEIIALHFDEYFYRTKNADVPVGMSALDHYFEIGSKEGRDPSPNFSVTNYIQANSHIAGSSTDPFFHYLMTAIRSKLRADGNRPSSVGLGPIVRPGLIDEKATFDTVAPEFDAEFYLSENEDVRKAGVDPLIHYLEYGWREGRNPNAVFWTAYYLSTNADVRAANINPFYHYLSVGRTQRRKPNPVSFDVWESPPAPSDAEWREAVPAKDVVNAQITVIIPVYKGYEDSLAAIHAVLTNPQRTRFELLVVNDSSPDRLLGAKLRELHAAGLFRYLENPKNLGFVGTINRALDEQPARDVILLNADTVVHGDWIDRLLAHAALDANIATITPFSNNATICSYPEPNRNNVLALEISPAEIDEYASIANRGRSSLIPTGVGFCFYMRRSVIDQIGKLDQQAFARGYGEENDFCMRALKAGYKNVFAQDVFVYHTGQVSFAGFAMTEYGSGQKALLSKHPDYRMRVQRYVWADPAREARLRIDLYRLAKQIGPDAAVFVTHPWQGGVKTHTRDLAARLAEENIRVVFLYAGKEGGSTDISIACPQDLSLYTPNLTDINVMKYPDLIGDFLTWLKPKILHVHSFAGLTWQAALKTMALIQDSGLPYFYTGHDFSSLCHRNHLVDNEGAFCHQPPVDVCRNCVRLDLHYRDVVDPQDRRDAYAPFLKSARGVFAPSADAAARLSRVFTDLALEIRPHEEFLPRTNWITMPNRFAPPLRVVVVGALGPHKGTSVIHDLALDARQRSLPIEFTIIGYSHMTDRLSELGVKETGPYTNEAEAMQLIRDYQPHLAMFPSIWPETYCYTLSLALAMGVPPVVFDLGAQAERLRAARVGRILDYDLISNPSALNDLLLTLPLRELWQHRRPPSFAFYPNMVENYYGFEALAPVSVSP